MRCRLHCGKSHACGSSMYAGGGWLEAGFGGPWLRNRVNGGGNAGVSKYKFQCPLIVCISMSDALCGTSKRSGHGRRGRGTAPHLRPARGRRQQRAPRERTCNCSVHANPLSALDSRALARYIAIIIPTCLSGARADADVFTVVGPRANASGRDYTDMSILAKSAGRRVLYTMNQ